MVVVAEEDRAANPPRSRTVSASLREGCSLPVEEADELLGVHRAREGPQTGARSARQYDWVDVAHCSTGLANTVTTTSCLRRTHTTRSRRSSVLRRQEDTSGILIPLRFTSRNYLVSPSCQALDRETRLPMARIGRKRDRPRSQSDSVIRSAQGKVSRGEGLSQRPRAGRLAPYRAGGRWDRRRAAGVGGVWARRVELIRRRARSSRRVPDVRPGGSRPGAGSRPIARRGRGTAEPRSHRRWRRARLEARRRSSPRSRG